jgi:hypothetical protein
MRCCNCTIVLIRECHAQPHCVNGAMQGNADVSSIKTRYKPPEHTESLIKSYTSNHFTHTTMKYAILTTLLVSTGCALPVDRASPFTLHNTLHNRQEAYDPYTTCSALPFWKQYEALGMAPSKGMPDLNSITPNGNIVVINIHSALVNLRDVRDLANQAKTKFAGKIITINILALETTLDEKDLVRGTISCYQCTGSRCTTKNEYSPTSNVRRVFAWPESVNLNIFSAIFDSPWKDDILAKQAREEKDKYVRQSGMCTLFPDNNGALAITTSNGNLAADVVHVNGYSPTFAGSNGYFWFGTGGLAPDKTNSVDFRNGETLPRWPVEQFSLYYACARSLVGLDGKTSSAVATRLSRGMAMRFANLDSRFATASLDALAILGANIALGASSSQSGESVDVLMERTQQFAMPIMSISRNVVEGSTNDLDTKTRESLLDSITQNMIGLSAPRTSLAMVNMQLAASKAENVDAFNAALKPLVDAVKTQGTVYTNDLLSRPKENRPQLWTLTEAFLDLSFSLSKVDIGLTRERNAQVAAKTLDSWFAWDGRLQKAFEDSKAVRAMMSRLVSVNLVVTGHSWPKDQASFTSYVQQVATNALAARDELDTVTSVSLVELEDMKVKYDNMNTQVAAMFDHPWIVGIKGAKTVISTFQKLTDEAKLRIDTISQYFEAHSNVARIISQASLDASQSVALVSATPTSKQQFVQLTGADLIRMQDVLVDQVAIACVLKPEKCKAIQWYLFDASKVEDTVASLFDIYA